MSEELEHLVDVDEENQAKLKALMEKDAKSGRSSTGVWKWIVAVLGVSMVVFYFFAAGVASVATQYHLGVYVFITYVLVFLVYPAGATWMRGLLSLFLGAVISCLVASLF
ncbi:MAG TPA: hypothetical protein VK997_11300, partial [Deferrisomatales bacterium]|nr:hypothetical protein [Deferrisomatales bacterium]